MWPSANTGPIPGAPGEYWGNIRVALSVGVRGLPGGDTLARLLDRHRRPDSPGGQRRWTAGEDELVRTLPAREAAARTGRSLASVYVRRHKLRVGRR